MRGVKPGDAPRPSPPAAALARALRGQPGGDDMATRSGTATDTPILPIGGEPIPVRPPGSWTDGPKGPIGSVGGEVDYWRRRATTAEARCAKLTEELQVALSRLAKLVQR